MKVYGVCFPSLCPNDPSEKWFLVESEATAFFERAVRSLKSERRSLCGELAVVQYEAVLDDSSGSMNSIVAAMNHWFYSIKIVNRHVLHVSQQVKPMSAHDVATMPEVICNSMMADMTELFRIYGDRHWLDDDKEKVLQDASSWVEEKIREKYSLPVMESVGLASTG